MAKKKNTSVSDAYAETREKRNEKEQNYLFWLTRFYVVFVLAVFPLYVGTEGYNDIVHSKAVFYWSITITLVILFLLFYLVYVFGGNRPLQLVPWYKRLGIADYALLAYLLVITLSCVFSPYKGELFIGFTDRNDGFLTIGLMIASFFVVSRWYRPKELDMTIYAASSMILCVIGYLQFYGYDIFNLFPYTQFNMIDGNGNPIYSGFSIVYRTTIGNINFVSIYTCIAVAVFTVLYAKVKTPIRFIHLAASVMNFAMMILGGSDGGKVGLLGALMLTIPFWIREKQSIGRFFVAVSAWGFAYVLHHWIVVTKVLPGITDSAPAGDIAKKISYSHIPFTPIVLLSIIGLAVGLALIFIKPQKWFSLRFTQIAGVAMIFLIIGGGILGIEVLGRNHSGGARDRIYEAREVLHGNISDEFGSYRVYVWRLALEKLSEQPLLGTGPDTFYKALGEEYQEKSKEAVGVVYDKAHNDFIQIAFCYGIIGLVAYLAFIISLLVKSIKSAYSSAFAFLSLCGVLAYLVQSLFGIDTIIVTPIFWLMMGVLRGAQLQYADAQN